MTLEALPKQETTSKLIEKIYDPIDRMSNLDFLSRDINRLKTITNPKISISPDKKEWEISNINFDFHGNKELYSMTTAGQVMLENVREINTPDWEIWSRTSKLKWEFFNSNNKRLVIWDKSNPEFKWYTNITAVLWDVTDIKNISSKSIVNYLNSNPDKAMYSDIIRASINRWIDPNVAIKIISPSIKHISLQSLERSAKVESILTWIERMRWLNNLPETEINNYIRNYYIENRVPNIISKNEAKKLIHKYFKFPLDSIKMDEALKVIKGESSYNICALRSFDKNPGWGNDIWLFQINSYWQRENMAKLGYESVDMFDVEKNMEVAVLAYKERWNTWKAWEAAKKIWLA